MASRATKPVPNGQQNRKMFNNFLDSLDIATSGQGANAALNSGGGYQQRTKSN